MGRHVDNERSPGVEFELAWKHYVPALWKFIFRGSDTHIFTGLSLRKRGADWLVIVRADEIVSFRAVVAFGSGAALTDALRNVSLAVSKGQFRVDKYAGK